MPRSLSLAVILTLFAALSVAAQSQDSSAPPPQTPSQDSATPPEAKKPKKVWTNDDVSHSNGAVSVVGDLKNFSAGEPSTSASGIKLNKSYEREPIEVQMRALQDKKKDLESKVDALLDEARKKGVDSSQLR